MVPNVQACRSRRTSQGFESIPAGTKSLSGSPLVVKQSTTESNSSGPMFNRLFRLILLLVILAILAGLGYGIREMMIASLKSHGFWHYVVRLVLISGLVFGIILVTQLLTAHNPTESLGSTPPFEPQFKFTNLLKRLVDIVLSVVVLTLLFPVLALIALLIFVLEGYPVFYISKRYISLDQCVSVLKFRTMVKDATSPKYSLKERYMRNGYLDIPLDCEVYTPIGRLLERTQIVEVLQLFNILLHGMSLIGNRPLPKENITLLRQFEGWEGRFASPAGLSGLSQVVGKLNQSPRERLELECNYSALYHKKGANIFLCDMYIIYYTIRLLIFGKPLPIEEARRMVAAVSGK